MAAYHCGVPLCTNDSRYDEKKQLSFHRFSGENKLRKEWIANISHDIGPHFQVIHTEMIVVHIRYILLPSRRTYTLIYKFVKRISKSKLRYNRKNNNNAGLQLFTCTIESMYTSLTIIWYWQPTVFKLYSNQIICYNKNVAMKSRLHVYASLNFTNKKINLSKLVWHFCNCTKRINQWKVGEWWLHLISISNADYQQHSSVFSTFWGWWHQENLSRGEEACDRCCTSNICMDKNTIHMTETTVKMIVSDILGFYL